MANGKISQKAQLFNLIVSWQASVSSTSTFLTKISNATKIAYLSKAHICLQLPRSHGMILSTVINNHKPLKRKL